MQLESAVAQLLDPKGQEGLTLGAASPLYYTEPQGIKAQPWFCNQVLRVQCSSAWTAPKLLQHMLSIEKKLGRTRPENPQLRFGPRPIDLDLLLFGQKSSDDSFCQIPHPRMLERAFVLIPLRHVLCQDTVLTPCALEKALQALPHSVQGNKIYQ